MTEIPNLEAINDLLSLVRNVPKHGVDVELFNIITRSVIGSDARL